MARFDVYQGDGPNLLLLDIQHDTFDYLDTRLVVPLMPVKGSPPAVQRLYPVFEIGGRRMLMATPLMSAVSARQLKKPISSLSGHRDEIISAIDFLQQGH
ncbi:CcdB family protein [Mesorhizobium sp. J428]|uniref:CcdB family protein n=1 Tax=Mesorhizobium sp. J428 TaxID=2898440 RepID=UPI002151FC56|nr:CcdB family protein [Mesorhizobium sp. J428]MCR5856951.1 CcdB family protein [Mesorhizobium sp. J428]